MATSFEILKTLNNVLLKNVYAQIVHYSALRRLINE